MSPVRVEEPVLGPERVLVPEPALVQEPVRVWVQEPVLHRRRLPEVAGRVTMLPVLTTT